MSDRVKLLFTRGQSIGGWFIRTALMSKYNHVGIQVDGMVYEATLFKGVRKVSINSFYEHNVVKVELAVHVDDKQALKDFLEEQVGKPYDWKAIVSLPFRRNWHNRESWMCSELAAEALIAGGARFPMGSNRITPRDLLFVTPAVVTVVDRHTYD